MTHAYTVNNLNFHYSNNFSLRIDHLKIDAHQITGVTGLNGTGKSTLLELLAFLLSPHAGSIHYFDKLVNQINMFSLRQKVSLLLQDTVLLKRSVFDNVAYGLKVRSTKKINNIVAQALDNVGLSFTEHATRQQHELSGGEAKRVALAARIAIEPDVLLLDEPTTNIDKFNKDIISQALMTLHKKKQTTIIVSSHDDNWLTSFATNIVELPKQLS